MAGATDAVSAGCTSARASATGRPITHRKPAAMLRTRIQLLLSNSVFMAAVFLRGGLSRCRRRILEIAAAVPAPSTRNLASFNRMSWPGALHTSLGVADEATCTHGIGTRGADVGGTALPGGGGCAHGGPADARARRGARVRLPRPG